MITQTISGATDEQMDGKTDGQGQNIMQNIISSRGHKNYMEEENLTNTIKNAASDMKDTITILPYDHQIVGITKL